MIMISNFEILFVWFAWVLTFSYMLLRISADGSGKARSFQVSRRGGHHWIPIVHKHSGYNLNPVAFPHDPSPSSASTGVPFPEWEEYTE